MMNVKDKPNKVIAKLIVEVEAEYYDDESSEETLRYCVEQDLEDAGFNVIDVSVMNNNFIWGKCEVILWKTMQIIKKSQNKLI